MVAAELSKSKLPSPVIASASAQWSFGGDGGGHHVLASRAQTPSHSTVQQSSSSAQTISQQNASSQPGVPLPFSAKQSPEAPRQAARGHWKSGSSQNDPTATALGNKDAQ